MAILKQSVAYSRSFSMVTSASHYLPLTGATPVVNLSKAGAAFVVADGAISQIANGFYKILLSANDVGTLGDLAYYITATSGDAVFMVDQVQVNLVSDISLDANGRVNISSNIRKNAALNGFTFVMTNSTTHAAQSGLTITAQRSLGGAGFAPCANAVSELSNGCYVINLSASDLNANTVLLRFTAAGADDLDIELLTQP